MLRKLLILSIVCLAVLGGGVATKSAQAENTHVMCPGVLKGVEFYRTATWGWQQKLGIAKTKPSVTKFHSCAFATWTAHKWAKQAHSLHIKYIRYTKTHANTVNISGFGNGLPPHAAGWLCIHASEGAWGSTNPNGHYNGLQMTYDWMGIIHGNPNNYSPTQILWAAETGYKNSGYSRRWLEGQWGQTIGPCWHYFE